MLACSVFVLDCTLTHMIARAQVSQVGLKQVLEQRAYMLFYTKDKFTPSVKPNPNAPLSTPVYESKSASASSLAQSLPSLTLDGLDSSEQLSKSARKKLR